MPSSKRKTYNTRLHDENIKKRNRLLGYSSILKGDATEQYVESIMKDFKGISELEVIGNIGGMFDITYRYPNDNIRAIQVKTLVQNKNIKDTWSVSFEQEYPQDTLIVLVNSDRTRFGLIPYSAIHVKTLSLGFTHMNKGKYRHNKYNNLEDFKNSLYRRSKLSTVYDLTTSVSKSILKEYNSLQRLSSVCTKLSIPFKRNTTNSTVVDCFINNQTVQCKYSSLIDNSNRGCRFSLHKSNGSVNGIHRVQPYSADDPLEYFIFEIGGTYDDPEKYHGYFCIVPKQALVDMEYLSTKEKIGRTQITIAPPDYSGEKSHWCLKYWNNFTGAFKTLHEESEGDKEYLIKDVIDHRNVGNTIEFLVEWAGFNVNDNTWEPEKNISHTDHYKLYREKYPNV